MGQGKGLGTQSSSIGNGWGLLESSTGEFKAMTEGGPSHSPVERKGRKEK